MSLDAGSLVAGTQYRGAFEERLQVTLLRWSSAYSWNAADAASILPQQWEASSLLADKGSVCPMPARVGAGGADGDPCVARGSPPICGRTSHAEYDKELLLPAIPATSCLLLGRGFPRLPGHS